jgi:ABC-type multidrug transport system ATPase subunit
MDEALIRAESLSLSFGLARALDRLTFALKKGSRTALLGPNGAGKSTLLGIIGGALAPDSGSISVNGQSPREARLEPGFLGWLPEGAPLNPELTVREHLRLAARLRGLSRKEGEREAERLANALDLGSKMSRLAGRLSLGGRRLAALALAFLGGPSLIVLDEPSASLDPGGVRRLGALISALPKEVTILMSSHMLSEVWPLADGALILSGGVIKAQGGWEELRASLAAGADPASPALPEEIYFQAAGAP